MPFVNYFMDATLADPYTLMSLLVEVVDYMLENFADPITRLMLSLTCNSARNHVPVVLSAVYPKNTYVMPTHDVCRHFLEENLIYHGTLELIQKYAPPALDWGQNARNAAILLDRGAFPILQWAATAKPSFCVVDKETIAHTACQRGDLEALQWCVTTAGPDSIQFLRGHSLYIAASHGHLPVVAYILGKRGHGLDDITFIAAMHGGHTHILQWLCDNGRIEWHKPFIRDAVTRCTNEVAQQWLHDNRDKIVY